MFGAIQWLRPRLRTLCVAFGAADLTLILLSIIAWYSLFDIAFEAQFNHLLAKYRVMIDEKMQSDTPPFRLLPYKEKRTEDTLRLQRTVRACGLKYGVDNDINQGFAEPAALIGAAMSGYTILGILLMSLSKMSRPAEKKIIASICLLGELSCTLILFVAVILLISNPGLCPVDAYYENFQPIVHTLVFTIIAVSSYKVYEISIIIFYLVEQARRLGKEMQDDSSMRKQMKLPHPRAASSASQMTLAVAGQKANRLGAKT